MTTQKSKSKVKNKEFDYTKYIISREPESKIITIVGIVRIPVWNYYQPVK